MNEWKVGDPLPPPDSKIIMGKEIQLTDDEKSRKFWGNVIGLVDIAVMILMGVVTYFIVRVLMELGIDIGPTIGAILSTAIVAGPMYYVNYILNEELDRRFPPFDTEDSRFPTFRGEINYNTEQARRGRQ